ncbi:SYCE1 [Cervus elaphus hippelaphus]|uniref:Synaptonemal complex central element protein 1 n=1 Tax=Cervus elaphus hippelaphus TaxID=46360 RepID=A0A212CNH0_CEREH|nr:SYCE1 [Cervus elaphus hippelaphus]
MAGRPGSSNAEPAGAVGPTDEARGQAKSSQKIEDLMGMVKKLQKAKKKASEELGDARTVWETLQKELDSSREEQTEAAEKPERLALEIGTLDSSKEQLLKEEKLMEAKLEDVKHRLCSQFGAKGHTISEGLFLRSQEAAAVVHLFEEENKKAQELLEAAAQRQEQLQQKCQQLQQKRHRLKEELEKLGVHIPAQAQSKQEEEAGLGEAANPKPLGVSEAKDPEPPSK